jgi:hypothetical protein
LKQNGDKKESSAIIQDIMVVGRIHRPIQALPPAHEDLEYIEQRFQAYYFTPEREWKVIDVWWNTRQHRAIFSDIHGRHSTVEVEHDLQITLREVLAINGIAIQHMDLDVVHGQPPPMDVNDLLDQSVEHMPLHGGTIWSHDWEPRGWWVPRPVLPEPALPQEIWEIAN